VNNSRIKVVFAWRAGVGPQSTAAPSRGKADLWP